MTMIGRADRRQDDVQVNFLSITYFPSEWQCSACLDKLETMKEIVHFASLIFSFICPWGWSNEVNWQNLFFLSLVDVEGEQHVQTDAIQDWIEEMTFFVNLTMCLCVEMDEQTHTYMQSWDRAPKTKSGKSTNLSERNLFFLTKRTVKVDQQWSRSKHAEIDIEVEHWALDDPDRNHLDVQQQNRRTAVPFLCARCDLWRWFRNLVNHRYSRRKRDSHSPKWDSLMSLRQSHRSSLSWQTMSMAYLENVVHKDICVHIDTFSTEVDSRSHKLPRYKHRQ